MPRAIAAVLVVVFVLIAPSAWVSWRLSGGVRRDLHAEGARVRVVAGPVGLLTGRVWQLEVLVQGATLDGIRVTELRGQWQGVTIDAPQALQGNLVVRHVAGGSATLTVTEGDLQRYLTVVKGVQDARVRLDGGVVAIQGGVAVLSAVVNISARGRLEVENAHRLLVRIDQMTINDITIPQDLGAALSAAINPLLTAPQHPVALTFTGVRVDNGRAVITAVPAQ